MKEQLSKQMLDVTLSSSPAQFQQLVEKERTLGAISCARQKSRSSKRLSTPWRNNRKQAIAYRSRASKSSSRKTSKSRCATGRV